MHPTRFAPSFSPTPEQATILTQQVLDRYARGLDGLAVLWQFRALYDTAHAPAAYPQMWEHAVPFVACDGDYEIHWLHPMIRAHLGAITHNTITTSMRRMRQKGMDAESILSLSTELHNLHHTDVKPPRPKGRGFPSHGTLARHRGGRTAFSQDHGRNRPWNPLGPERAKAPPPRPRADRRACAPRPRAR